MIRKVHALIDALNQYMQLCRLYKLLKFGLVHSLRLICLANPGADKFCLSKVLILSPLLSYLVPFVISNSMLSSPVMVINVQASREEKQPADVPSTIANKAQLFTLYVRCFLLYLPH